MKLVTFKVHTEERLGALVGDNIVDLTSGYALYLREVHDKANALVYATAVIPPCMKGFLQSGDESLEAAEKTLEYIKGKDEGVVGLDGEKIILKQGEARLCTPIPSPGAIYCLAVNYYDHATERIKDPEQKKAAIEGLKKLNIDVPVTFMKAPNWVCGPGDPIIKPKNSERVDYECELAVVIGKKAKYVPKEKAYDYIAGYTILIDVSFRDQGFPRDVEWNFYRRSTNWTKGKGMDNASPIGPCIVTKDEVPNPYSPPLRLVTRVNGEVRQNNDVTWMIIKIPRIIEYLSNGTTLEPGDIIATGTVSGVARSWDGYLKAGDVVECEIQPIGVLKHIVVADQS